MVGFYSLVQTTPKEPNFKCEHTFRSSVIELTYLSISVHHRMSSFSFMQTGKCWSLPCLMELDLVVMVLTLPNYRRQRSLGFICHFKSLFKQLTVCISLDKSLMYWRPLQCNLLHFYIMSLLFRQFTLFILENVTALSHLQLSISFSFPDS